MAEKINIGIDIRDLRVARTGTQTYLNELCREFKSMENDKINFFFFDTALPIYKGEVKLLKLVEHLRYQIWKQITLPLMAWFKNCDIVFCTDNYVPLIKLGFKTVPVFHDAFFFENPEHFNKHWLWLYRKLALPAARNSPIVITPTLYAKEQIHSHTKIDLDKLIVVYEGPKSLHNYHHEIENNEPGQKVLPNLNVFNGEYILHVGVMNKRKNIPALIQAFKELKKRKNTSLKLVLAGQMDTKTHSRDSDEIWKAIKTGGFEEDIVLTGYLSDSELNKVYAGACMYVFPSVNEGFGIPILEAWFHNLPVIVANNTCLPEVGGDGVITFNPFDIHDIAQKMELVLENETVRRDITEKGKKRLGYFTWKRTAETILKEFTSLLERDKNP